MFCKFLNGKSWMNNKIKKRLILLGSLCCIFILISAISVGAKLYRYYCSPQVIIVNESNNALTEITLTGTGFQSAIDSIPQKTTIIETIKPTGESGLKISFNANSQTYSKDGDCYLEPRGGYKVKITIDPELNIEAICES
jgi:hypothetical protein